MYVFRRFRKATHDPLSPHQYTEDDSRDARQIAPALQESYGHNGHGLAHHASQRGAREHLPQV